MKLAHLFPVLAVVTALASCSASEPVVEGESEPTSVPVTETPPPVAPTEPAEPSPTVPTVADVPTAEAVTSPVPAFVGEWPNRFCVDRRVVETTLNLRAGPSTESEVLASIPRFSCNLISGGLLLENNFQPVVYTTIDGATEGWVSNNFIESQDPPTEMVAVALLFVDAWQMGVDTNQYGYEVGDLPSPITDGDPVALDGGELGLPGGCQFIGDITVECIVALVESDGTEVARMSLGATQRGIDGRDRESFWSPDFPDGPTITSFTILTDS